MPIVFLDAAGEEGRIDDDYSVDYGGAEPVEAVVEEVVETAPPDVAVAEEIVDRVPAELDVEWIYHDA